MEILSAAMFFGFMFLIFSAILISIAGLILNVWMLVDCINREEEGFKDKTLWMILLVLGLFLQYSLIISLVYYFVVKKGSK